MKNRLLIVCTLLAAQVLAEPPVENRYLPPSDSYSTTNQERFSPPSSTYGAPQRQTQALVRRPSPTYGAPRQSNTFGSQTRTPSQQYGSPNGNQNGYTPRNQPRPFMRQSAPSDQYNTPSQQYNAPTQQYNAPSQQYGAPSTPNQQYGAPSIPSQQYGAPSAPNQRYGAPSTPNQQFGVPSTPSQQYGAPDRNQNGLGSGAPSQQYGPPSNQYLPPDVGSDRGYTGDDENNEPANYNFEYMVKDEPSGNDFGHRESRMGDRAEGLYYVLLPDGRKQTVEYEADQNGYRPKISYEDTNSGYDRNSQSGRSGQDGYPSGGPY